MEEAQDYQKYGMSAYLRKPFSAEELWACLLQFLRPAAAEEERELAPVLPSETAQTLPFRDKTPENGIIDEESGLHLAGGDTLLYTRLKVFFFQRNKNFFEEFRKTASRDIPQAHRMIHTQKAGAALIGAKKLHEAASVIEKSLTRARLRGVKDFGDYEKILNDTLDYLEPLAETYSTCMPESI
jgi:HPt (histidine-containing phosphotransfer) domain-containing protein